MDINRNQWFMIGVVVFLLGLQLRAVNVYWLNEEATRILAEQTEQTTPAEDSFLTLTASTPAAPKKEIRPPDWSGWCLLSVGSVLILHSLAMKKPD